jgi:hypothetical protein
LQEDIERRAIAITLSAGRLTSRTLAKAFAIVLRQMQKIQEHAKTPRGKQSVKQLMNHDTTVNTIPLTPFNGGFALFDRMARKYNVDYAYKVAKDPQKSVLFFKASQADAIKQCFAEYTKRVMKKEEKFSIRVQMRDAEKMARESRPKERAREQEAARDGR